MIQVVNVPTDADKSSKGWVQWFASVGDALKGKWGTQVLTYTGTAPSSAKWCVQGRQVILSVNWSAGPITGGTFALPAKVLPGLLQISDTNGTLVGAGYADGSVLTIPPISTASRLIGAGALILQEV
jgi:hypothetical protein